MGVKYTNECFKLNGLVNKDEKVLEVKNIFNKMENKNLILSKIYQKKLEKQASCLAFFLLKIFGFNKEYLKEYEAPKAASNQMDAIYNHYKLSIKELNKVYRWNNLPIEFSYELVNFKKNTKEYKELNKCIKFLTQKLSKNFNFEIKKNF
uniref:Uncharacterized protein n=1 Tax=Meloidogyne enterolobii TaxID=390850 RepID=A0A6V7UF58_MELEN|nr:unnamed protein product [Meloidogyne enterolobii]